MRRTIGIKTNSYRFPGTGFRVLPGNWQLVPGNQLSVTSLSIAGGLTGSQVPVSGFCLVTGNWYPATNFLSPACQLLAVSPVSVAGTPGLS
ncbi:hypothetical protein A3860_38430 [Niastella vici]|uniref:Uncharacterized protein n=1 Tax=Niastella vici TaxID=1703345 RepID=A0A1V9FLI2_9BACT|nr:hypothetical protein [Niastella vici]OQP59188.1 hypothetical protein A3860_38430 [Niastella vici]